MNLESFQWSVVLISALLGALVGSFSNVLIYRIPRGQSIAFPPSNCTQCNHRLGVLDLVPILSWAALGGKCRYCKAPISSRYPVIEAISALGYAALALFLPVPQFGLLGLLGLFVLFTGLLVGSAIDLERKELPDPLTLGLLPVGLVFAFLNEQTGGTSGGVLPDLGAALEGAALGAGSLALLGAYGSWLNRRAEPHPIYPVGWMQMTLAALVGCLLAAFGVPYAAAWGLGAAVLSGGLNFALRRAVPIPDWLTLLGVPVVLLVAGTLASSGQIQVSLLSVLSSGTIAAGWAALLIGVYWWFAPEPQGTEASAADDRYSRDYGAMGFGDVKWMGMIGAFLGWTVTGLGMVLSVFLGAVLGLVIYARTRDRQIPFGPFLALGALIALFYRTPLEAFVRSLFNFG